MMQPLPFCRSTTNPTLSMTTIQYKTQLSVRRPDTLRAGEWTINNITQISVVLGRNGCGKSSLLRAIRDASPETRHYVVPERTGSFTYSPSLIQNQVNPQTRMEVTKQNHSENHGSQVIARIHAYFLARGSSRANELRCPPDDLEKFLGMLLPEFTVKLSGSGSPLTITRNETASHVSTRDELSSGETQLLLAAIDILTIAAIWEIENRPERLLLVDEPDVHLHPDLQAQFARFLVAVAKEYELQVLVATHSTSLLASIGHFTGGQASVVYFDRHKSNFSAAPFNKTLQNLASCLGGHALMGPLFGIPLLLVEGDDDYRIWSHVPRGSITKFAVLPSNGDEIRSHQRTLEKVFAALRGPNPTKPAGFALIDCDKGKPTPSADAPQEHIRFIQLSCRESENLYLSDDVLTSVGTTWKAVCDRAVKDAATFGEKADALRNVAGMCRKSGDFKSIINQLEQVADNKKVPWTMRVGQLLGRARPTAQLADFLGPEVLEALWGNP